MATSNSEVVYGNKFYTISSPVRNTLPNPVVSPPSATPVAIPVDTAKADKESLESTVPKVVATLAEKSTLEAPSSDYLEPLRRSQLNDIYKRYDQKIQELDAQKASIRSEDSSK